MKFLKHIRGRSKNKNASAAEQSQGLYQGLLASHSTQSRSWNKRAATLPPKVLRNIFSFVCPHALDETYDSLEQSMVDGEDGGCMLCSMRDLANCARVCHGWYGVAQDFLYGSIRIDAVHYCELEVTLSEKRKQRSRFNRNAEPKDAPQQRLQLLCRTVRETQRLALQVHLLKLPYMTRETSKVDLARTVSALPNLRYVDLPEGVYSDDAACHALRQEVQARCPDLRKMRYIAGSEHSLSLLASGRHWQHLERLELAHLDVEPATLLQALAFLPTLHDLKMSHLEWLDDSVFSPPRTGPLPAFPALQHLTLSDTPALTATGLTAYLSRPETREALTSLRLSNTGIQPQTLHAVLANAPRLTLLSITEIVSRSFPIPSPPHLASASLQTLHYEITSATQHSLHPPASSYYAYLVSSLQANGLSALRELYIRDPTLAETLLLVPPAPAFSFNDDGINAGPPAPPPPPVLRPLHPLNIYTKGLDELEWNLTTLSPAPAPGKRASLSPQRPVSAYKLLGAGAAPSAVAALGSASTLWGGAAARDSVVVGNGFGGFLAVPRDDDASASGGGAGAGGASAGGRGGLAIRKKNSRQDLWR
ncbi:MAG: hypothetical protein M1825_005893 [Sarcosagium campestre]|nr:MAG: hypothetical protein M1825_005893 [Sarcosagium campestre]